MNIQMRLRREVALEMDRDDVYDHAKAIGERAGTLKRAQITGLESIANGTQKVSDVLNYIKRQTARHKEWHEVGPALLAYIEGTGQQQLRGIRDTIVQRLACVQIALDDYQKQEVYIQLVRAFVGQLAAQYEFANIGKADGRSRPDDD